MSLTGALLTGTYDDSYRDQEREGLALDQRRAMDQFLADVERRAFRIAQVGVRDADDALDIVQDAMIRLVRNYAEKPSDEWRPLFFRILQNRIRDHQRRQYVQKKIFARFTPGNDSDNVLDPIAAAEDRHTPPPDGQVKIDDAMHAVEQAVINLPHRQQQAFLFRAMEGLNIAATAKAMGCSQGSVKTHYSRAIRALRAALGDHW